MQINAKAARESSFSADAYDLLVAEIAIFRGQTDLAVEHYLRVAKSQDNPEIAERAVRIAVYGENMEAATEAARRWIELEPDRAEARQIIAAIYIRQEKAEEAFHTLTELLKSARCQTRNYLAH